MIMYIALALLYTRSTIKLYKHIVDDTIETTPCSQVNISHKRSVL